MTELLPCPFCGATDVVICDPGVAWIKCPACMAEGPADESESEATRLWNARAVIPASAQGAGTGDMQASVLASLDATTEADVDFLLAQLGAHLTSIPARVAVRSFRKQMIQIAVSSVLSTQNIGQLVSKKGQEVTSDREQIEPFVQGPTRAQLIRAFETIRVKLVNCFDEPERSAFWLAVQMRDALRAQEASELTEGRRGAADITAERQRQVTAEGWSPDHDDEHADHQIPLAALCYLYASIYDPGSFVFRYWPWDRAWWKPADARRNLVKAGALIAAEIDRLDRASQHPSTDRGGAA